MKQTQVLKSSRIVSQPISPPTRSRQHRAIGLLWAKYVPGGEEFNKGVLIASDGTVIDAVVKGQLFSLIKSKLDLTVEHLWIVYPKTPPEDSEIKLHIQMMGIWEPEILKPNQEIKEFVYRADDFSIQGEVAYQDFQNGIVLVTIKQKPKSESDRPKFFKIRLKGFLPPKSIKHFWQFKVRRIGQDLVIISGESVPSPIGAGGNSSGGGRKPFQKQPFNQNRENRPFIGSPKPMPKKPQS
jgi:hypothetical protein